MTTTMMSRTGSHGSASTPAIEAADALGDLLGLYVAAFVDLKSRCPRRIDEAAGLLYPGPVATSGIGKSGMAARRAAAVFSTLGTPAQFIHPVEAMHGELGALQATHALLVISHSGDTPEVVRLAHHAKGMEVPVVAICGRQASPLARLADCLVHVSMIEAKAPTTRALVASMGQMAVCDALALALAAAGGLTAEDAARLHPAGSPPTARRCDP